ncbi:hypothetical protein THZG08_10135 [Vibrio owensii]|nr:hypothetical protein THZG08_10135 [Vibrio owensii]CAH1548655.1 hypothetical protein THOA03_10134 [Vibrio owensii]
MMAPQTLFAEYLSPTIHLIQKYSALSESKSVSSPNINVFTEHYPYL